MLILYKAYLPKTFFFILSSSKKYITFFIAIYHHGLYVKIQ
ncbi:putative membrane protein [Rickettsia rhipicephali str. Ect]|uniref:Putative membrane protein n=1 Tax=Rickettsia rhipicephali str. Ect TaxID=1359199 RepID=A0A0F3PKB6_RICRH|nr:putative membrane protein [Rickettsia rhipicephali str. Ect]